MGRNWTGFRFLVLLSTLQTLQTPDPVPHSSHQEISLQPSKNQAKTIINNIRNIWLHPGVTGWIMFYQYITIYKGSNYYIFKFAAVIVV